MNSIFTYLDYRLCIKDWYLYRKQLGNPVSYRVLAASIGLKSPAHITQILKGKALLPDRSVLLFSELAGFNRKQSEYFSLLVAFCQCKNREDKNLLYKKMLKYCAGSTVLLHPDQFAYYQKWYYSAIHDILSFFPFSGDFKALAGMVEPSITTREAGASVKLLERLSFITKNSEGTYTCNYPGISAYAEGKSVVLGSYATVMIDRAKVALDNVPESERLISWAGISVSQKTFEKIKEETREFRKRLIALARNDDSPDRAYHLNIQLFPVSKQLDRRDTPGGSV